MLTISKQNAIYRVLEIVAGSTAANLADIVLDYVEQQQRTDYGDNYAAAYYTLYIALEHPTNTEMHGYVGDGEDMLYLRHHQPVLELRVHCHWHRGRYVLSHASSTVYHRSSRYKPCVGKMTQAALAEHRRTYQDWLHVASGTENCDLLCTDDAKADAHRLYRHPGATIAPTAPSLGAMAPTEDTAPTAPTAPPAPTAPTAPPAPTASVQTDTAPPLPDVVDIVAVPVHPEKLFQIAIAEQAYQYCFGLPDGAERHDTATLALRDDVRYDVRELCRLMAFGHRFAEPETIDRMGWYWLGYEGIEEIDKHAITERNGARSAGSALQHLWDMEPSTSRYWHHAELATTMAARTVWWCQCVLPSYPLAQAHNNRGVPPILDNPLAYRLYYWISLAAQHELDEFAYLLGIAHRLAATERYPHLACWLDYQAASAALEDDEHEVAYQALVTLVTRWHRVTRGLAPWESGTGIINRLHLHMLNAACTLAVTAVPSPEQQAGIAEMANNIVAAQHDSTVPRTHRAYALGLAALLFRKAAAVDRAIDAVAVAIRMVDYDVDGNAAFELEMVPEYTILSEKLHALSDWLRGH